MMFPLFPHLRYFYLRRASGARTRAFGVVLRSLRAERSAHPLHRLFASTGETSADMMPLGHAAVGYLLYVPYAVRRRVDPHGGPLLALLFGTQFPDLADKPLGWSLGVLPSGRSLAHSLLTATVVLAVVLYAARRRGRWYWGTAFGIGYVSHLAADSVLPALRGRPDRLTNLGWPLLPPPDYGAEHGFGSYFAGLYARLVAGDVSPFLGFQLTLVVVASVVAASVAWRNRASAPGSR